MDVLVVLGTTAAWFYGLVLFFIGHFPVEESTPDAHLHESQSNLTTDSMDNSHTNDA